MMGEFKGWSLGNQDDYRARLRGTDSLGLSAISLSDRHGHWAKLYSLRALELQVKFMVWRNM